MTPDRGGLKVALKRRLVGNVQLVTKAEVLRTFGLFAAIAVVHVLLRRKFLMVTFHEDQAKAKGIALRPDGRQRRPDHGR